MTEADLISPNLTPEVRRAGPTMAILYEPGQLKYQVSTVPPARDFMVFCYTAIRTPN
jgi:hypothetical protein